MQSPNTLIEINNAIRLAVLGHRKQARKNLIKLIPLPYITHPIEVMKMVWGWGAGTIISMQAAVCHDILEDTSITFEKLKEVIGIDAAKIVEELTFVPPKGLSSEQTNYLKLDYLRGFRDSSLEALIIKLADRCCNSLDFVPFDIDKAGNYYRDAEPLFQAFFARVREIEVKFGTSTAMDIQTTLLKIDKEIFK